MKVDIDLVSRGKGNTEELTDVDTDKLEKIVKSHLPARDVQHITIHKSDE